MFSWPLMAFLCFPSGLVPMLLVQFNRPLYWKIREPLILMQAILDGIAWVRMCQDCPRPNEHRAELDRHRLRFS